MVEPLIVEQQLNPSKRVSISKFTTQTQPTQDDHDSPPKSPPKSPPMSPPNAPPNAPPWIILFYVLMGLFGCLYDVEKGNNDFEFLKVGGLQREPNGTINGVFNGSEAVSFGMFCLFNNGLLYVLIKEIINNNDNNIEYASLNALFLDNKYGYYYDALLHEPPTLHPTSRTTPNPREFYLFGMFFAFT